MKKTPHVTPRDVCNEFWVETTKPVLEGKLGTAFSLANGHIGIRGAHEEVPEWGRPELYVTGTFANGPSDLLGFHDPDHILSHPDRIKTDVLELLDDQTISTLPNLPNPLSVELTVGGIPFSFETSKILTNERLAEMDRAVMRRRLVFRDDQGRRTCVDSKRFVSFADRNIVCLRYEIKPLGHDAPVAVVPFINTGVTNTNGVRLWRESRSENGDNFNAIECLTSGTDITVSVAQNYQIEKDDGTTVLTIFAAAGAVPLGQAQAAAKAAAGRGFDTCLQEHLEAYAAEQDKALVQFDANPDTVQGFNFGQMHLQMAFCYDRTDVGIPIKGLTGHGYRFANFWDTDFHMFPYYLMTKPEQVHNILLYRYNQLPVYRENARQWGAKGAQVPWETQTAGCEVTAPWLCLQEREIHISADAAYMFKLYDDLTPNHDMMVEKGAEFAMETARFYASRIVWSEENQRFELPDIGCPDQYHTFADNNIFISMFARWNLQFAAELAQDPQYAAAVEKIAVTQDDIDEWQKKAAGLYIIPPNEDGIIEEFDGFFELSEDLNGISETFCSHSQAVKQPDVVAAFIPFESYFDEEIRRRNWQFYADRTLHGSSLSLPGMAYSAARCGLLDEALYYLHKSARMDLDDVNLDTERGVHLAGYAVQWHTVVFGFGGLTPTKAGLVINPRLPRQWGRLQYRVHWQFQPVTVTVTHENVTVEVGTKNGTAVPVEVNGSKETVNAGASKTFSVR